MDKTQPCHCSNCTCHLQKHKEGTAEIITTKEATQAVHKTLLSKFAKILHK